MNSENDIRRTPQHTYHVLTKRAKRLPQFFASREVPPNLWLGVSVEDKEYGLPRIDELRKVKAGIRFLSLEPLLEDVGTFNLKGIHWVIVGGESGFGARPMKAEWVISIKDQCLTAVVAFFFKRWGAWNAEGVRNNKKANGRELNGSKWEQYPSG